MLIETLGRARIPDFPRASHTADARCRARRFAARAETCARRNDARARLRRQVGGGGGRAGMGSDAGRKWGVGGWGGVCVAEHERTGVEREITLIVLQVSGVLEEEAIKYLYR